MSEKDSFVGDVLPEDMLHRTLLQITVFLTLAHSVLSSWTGATCASTGKFESEKGNFVLSWCFPSSDEIQLTYTLSGTSFIGLGFGGSMFDADMIIGWVNGSTGESFVDDYYSNDEKAPLLDTALGGQSNVKLLEGYRSNGNTATVLTVLRKLSTGDVFDRDILSTGTNDIVYAWQSSQDGQGLIYHADNHNHIHIDFSKSDGIPDTTFGYEESGSLSRELIQTSYFGVLSTWQSEAAGSDSVSNYPYGSATDIADDGHGKPLMLLSDLERNVINSKAYAPCSLHVYTTPNSTFLLNHPEYFDVMTKPRTTLLGRLEPVPEVELEDAKALYLKKHPTSKAWIGFSDFVLYRLEIADVYVVGGFGNEHYIGWISASQYLSASGHAIV